MNYHTNHPTLYTFRRCPYAMRARLAIQVSGITVEIREIKIQNKPIEFLNLSPKGTVPVLQISNDHLIEESLDIMEWALEINDPFNWLPKDYNIKNQMTYFLKKLDKVFKVNLDKYKYTNKFEKQNTIHYRDKNLIVLTELNHRLETSKGINSEYLSYIDYATFPFIRQFRNVDPIWFDSLKLPFLKTWLYDLMNSDEFASVMEKFDLWDPMKKPIYSNFSF
jgi:glutathione S-transferase